jgi:hypothetical protein
MYLTAPMSVSQSGAQLEDESQAVVDCDEFLQADAADELAGPFGCNG